MQPSEDSSQPQPPGSAAPTGQIEPGALASPIVAAAVPPRRRRRWLRVLLVLASIFVTLSALLIATLPWIASQPALLATVLHRINAEIGGELAVSRVRLGWTGPLVVEGLRLRDTQRQDVVQIERVELESGLWRLITNPTSPGKLRLGRPRVQLLLDASNRPSLAAALAPRSLTRGASEPAKSRSSRDTAKSPASARTAAPDAESASNQQSAAADSTIVGQIFAGIEIQDGELTIERPGQEAYRLEQLGLSLQIATLDDLSATLTARAPGGGQLQGKARLTGLTPHGRIDPQAACGEVSLKTDQPIAIGALADLLLQQRGLSGAVTLALEAKVAQNDLLADLNAELRGFQQVSLHGAEPLDLACRGALSLRDALANARLRVEGGPGILDATLKFPTDRPLPEIDVERLAAALLGGEPLTLPQLELQLDGRLDLAAFERAAPGLLPLRPGLVLTAGQVQISALELRGGAEPLLSGVIRSSGLTARDGPRGIALSDAQLELDATLPRSGGLLVRRAELHSSFARVSASGSAADLRTQFQADLGNLRRELGQVFDLAALELSGQLAGELALKRAADGRFDTQIELTARQARYAEAGRALDVPQASLSQRGGIALAQGRITRIDAQQLSADLNGELLLRGTGNFEPDSKAFTADLELTRADAAALARRAKSLGMSGLDELAAELSGRVKLARAAAADAALLTSGAVTARGVRFGGRALAESDTSLAWEQFEFTAKSGALRLASAVLKSSAADVTLRDWRANASEGRIESGKLELAGELPRMLALVGGAQSQMPDLRGRVQLVADVSQSGGLTKLTGNGNIAGFEFGPSEKRIREERVELLLDAAFEPGPQRLTLGNNRLTSKLLNAQVQGSIDELSGRAVAALRGDLSASWSELTALLHSLVPASAELLIVRGGSQHAFTLSGPLNDASATPAFRAAQAASGLSWQSATLAGVAVGAAELRVSLADGQVQLSGPPISASQGAVTLAGTLDLRGAAPVLRMPGKTRVLGGVRLSPELTRELLSRINPIFMHVASAEGTVQLDVKDLALPFGLAAKAESSGSGRLELIDMKLQPSGFLVELLRLGGVKAERDALSVLVKGLDFSVERGRVLYRDFTLIFPSEFDLKFLGSVGLDDTLDLFVSVPVRPELLEAFKVRGPVVEYSRFLAGARVEIPIVGTRQQPRLDVARVDIQPLVERAIQGGLKQSGEKAVDDALRKLLGGDKPR